MLISSPDAFFAPTDKPWLELTRLTRNRDGTKLGHKVQHRANVAWAARVGIVIGDWYKEENVSTSDEGVTRETWERVLSEISAGMWGGLIVWRADRLTRQLREFVRLHEIAKVSRTLIACSYDGVTTIDPAGVRRIVDQVSAAEQEVSTLKIRVTANSSERKTTGMYHGGGHRPWCFEAPKKDKATGRIKNSGRVGMKHNKTEVALAQEAANRIAWEGWTYRDVITDWHQQTPPVYGATGAPWSTGTLQTALTSPRMIGRVSVTKVDPVTGVSIERLKAAKWKAVLDEVTWRQLCSMKKTAVHKDGKTKYLLTPVSECGGCHLRLTGCVRKYMKAGVLTPVRKYRCRSNVNDKARGACGQLQVLAEPVEDLVKAFIFERLGRTKEFGSGVHGVDDLEPEIVRQSAHVDRLAADLKALRNAQESSVDRLPMAEYLPLRRRLTEELNDAKARVALLIDQLTVPAPIGTDWDNLWDWFDHLNLGQQLRLVRAHVKKVVVLPVARSGRYFKPERVEITPADAQETDRQGDEAGV